MNSRVPPWPSARSGPLLAATSRWAASRRNPVRRAHRSQPGRRAEAGCPRQPRDGKRRARGGTETRSPPGQHAKTSASVRRAARQADERPRLETSASVGVMAAGRAPHVTAPRALACYSRGICRPPARVPRSLWPLAQLLGSRYIKGRSGQSGRLAAAAAAPGPANEAGPGRGAAREPGRDVRA